MYSFHTPEYTIACFQFLALLALCCGAGQLFSRLRSRFGGLS
ncbi:hypothetical protein [Neiella holothuriorum]|nr:hypothetical protein [Neiella holothuriorum]